MLTISDIAGTVLGAEDPVVNETDPITTSWELPWGAGNNSNSKNHNIVLLTLELCESDQKVLCFIRGSGAWHRIEQGIFRKPGS